MLSRLGGGKGEGENRIMIKEKVDCIIVGAGPAGISAAYVLAKSGLQVVVLERGTYPGAKNVMGGILFTTILNKLIPEFWNEAPLERHLTNRKFCLLSPDTEMGFSFKTQRYNRPPFNNTFTVLRAKFDRWFAQKAEEAGAMVLSEVVVDDFIWENNQCKGVKTRLSEGELYSDVVILAEGANGVLSEKAGLRKISSDGQMVIAVKEIISLPKEAIEDRFCLRSDEGLSIEYFGDAVKGMFGNGFIYTNQESISIGVGCSIKEVAAKKIKTEELLEYFKSHPCVHCLIRGGETQEYLAHMIPEGGYRMLHKLVGNGLILVGDCAGLVNTSHFHEGSNLAMASGVMAAETVIQAKGKGDFTEEILSLYVEKLKNSFVFKDLQKFEKFPKFFQRHSEIFTEYPEIFAELLTDYFSVSEVPKKQVEKEIFKKFKKKVGILKPSRTLFGLARGMDWI